MKSLLSIAGICMVALLLAASRLRSVQSTTDTLTDDTFSRLHANIVNSTKNEKWTEIPWMIDIQRAREVAAKERKPIFMWAMNGHPLGCT